MNFEESNQFVEQLEKNNKNKKTVLTVLIICAVLVVILFGIIAYIRKKDAAQLKIYVDDKQVKISSSLLLQSKDGVQYMNVRELAELLGYSYQKGEYKNYTEDAKSCYLRTPYEIVSMSANSNTVTKYILNENARASTDEQISKDLILVDEKTGKGSINIVVDSENETEEIFTIDEAIQYVNDELYVPFPELAKIFSVQLNTSQANRIRISSIPSLVQTITKLAQDAGYTEVSNIYENLMAMADNMLVVGDGSKYGVISLKDGKEVISLKYDKIVYRQNTEEFFVTAEESVGIVDASGNTIIKPTAYDNIASLDELQKLYLVEKNDKFGVVNHEGNIIVYAEYDSIGIEDKEEFAGEDIRNFNLLFEECIPVYNNDKVGIIDVDGEERLKCVYDSLGYVANSASKENLDTNNRPSSREEDDEEEENITNTTNTSTNQSASVEAHESVLTIPESVGIKGIVVKQDNYGIFDAEAKRLIVPCVYSKIYAKTRAGVTKYYLEYDEQEIDLKQFLQENDLVSVSAEKDENSTENEIEE